MGAVVVGVGWNSKLSCWCRLCSNVVVTLDGKKVLRTYRGTRVRSGYLCEMLEEWRQGPCGQSTSKRPEMRRGAVEG